MINRKSQAALEFIMTYGWAILVVLVAIGALAYFGVLSPDKFLPSRCTLQSGIACLDFTVVSTGASTGDITVVLQNSVGFDLTGVSIDIQTCPTASAPISLSNGEKAAPVTLTGCTVQGAKYSGYINVTYTTTDSGLTHHNIGDITARVG